MKEIKLTQGKVALVDDEDFEELNKYKWSVAVRGHNIYVGRNKKMGLNKWSRVYMHREILKDIKEGMIDHIDGNGLNNCKLNLRPCSRSQNNQNIQYKNPKCVSRFKGVWYDKRYGTWVAKVDNKYLGSYGDEEDAARAYNNAALLLFKEFAYLNNV